MKILDFILPALSPKLNPHFFPLGRGGGPAGNYAVPRSLRFRASASASLTRVFSVVGNRKTLTINAKVKRGALGSIQQIFGTNAAGTIYGYLRFTASDTLEVFDYQSSGGTFVWQVATTQVFRDPGAWYDITVTIDTAQATAADRVKIHIGPTQVTALSVANYPALNLDTSFNFNTTHYIGSYISTGSYFDGYLAEFNLVGGQALTPSSFGQIDTTTGQWVAKKYTGTYGTNGFYLPFDDATNLTTLTADKSGNGNNWTATNISLTSGPTYDSMLDVPAGNAWSDGGNGRGNYATLNPIDKSGTLTLSNGNLNFTSVAAAAGSTLATLRLPESGAYYFEGGMPSFDASGQFSLTVKFGATSIQVNRFSSNNGVLLNGVLQTAFTLSTTDVIGFSADVNTGIVKIYLNNVLQYTSAAYSLAGAAIDAYASWTTSGYVNFGQRPFAYTPPAGFKALHTGNLPEPAIKKPTDHHNVYTVTKTGNTNFTLDWDATVYDTLFWIKRRDAAGNWFQIDGLRGYDKYLSSNQTIAEVTDANVIGVAGTTITLKSTLPDGVYVIEAWKAGRADSRQTNTSGTITSTVSANVLAGFSIVAYTGTGANATVGHGLGIAPKMVIVKNRNLAATGWPVFHAGMTSAGYFLDLSSTAAQTGNSTVWNNTAPSAAIVTIGTANTTNGSANSHVAYCHAEVPQYSKFGSYVGNGSADGPFVYTGFLPMSDLVKASTAVGDGTWVLLDNARSPSNVMSAQLYPNSNALEGVAAVADGVSNGLKFRGTYNSYNASGATYITSMFAQAPIKYANAR